MPQSLKVKMKQQKPEPEKIAYSARSPEHCLQVCVSYRLLTLNYLLSMYKPAIFYPQTMEEICDLLRGSTKQNYPDKRQGFLPFSCLMSESTFFLLCNQNLSAVVLVYKCGEWTGQTAMSSFPTSCPTKAEWRTIFENELRTTFVKLR